MEFKLPIESIKNSLFVKSDLLLILNNAISDSLRNHLNQSYLEPSASSRQKHPTRYEKFLLDGKTYIVNYRMSIDGRTSFAIFNLLSFINEAHKNHLDVMIILD